MDYRNASAEDFSNDALFKDWTLNPNAATDKFWEDFQLANPDKVESIEEAREYVRLLNSEYDPSFDDAINLIKRNVDAYVLKESNPSGVTFPVSPPSEVRVGVKPYYYKVAAAITTLIVAGMSTYYFYTRNDNVNRLADGTSQTKLEVPRGKRSFITLPDGTNIWLNADSHLKYNTDFNTTATRDVYLEGEAFFEVTENKSRPFIVHTSHISIKVLGTAFNVRSFEHDPIIETTLVRGRVAINSDASPGKEIALLPSEQAVFKKDSKELILQHHIETDNYTSWKQGELIFDEKSLSDIIKDLERWYNVRIHMENLGEQKCSFSGRFKNEPLSEVLGLFKSSDDVSFEIRDRDVYITGNPCNN